MKAKVGTPYYIAPEVIKGDYTEKCDIWSMGVILYVLISGAPPFYGPNDLAILDSVKKGRYEFDMPVWKTISGDCKDLISKMLLPEEKRLNSQQVLDHPWLHKYAAKDVKIELPSIVTKSLGLFKGAQKVKKAVLSYLATQLSEKDMKNLRKIFLALDKNGDGQLSQEEISKGVKSDPKLTDLTSLVKSMDTDGSGSIDYNEFLAAAIGEEVYLNKGKLQQAFNMFDKDKSGTIELKEIKDVIGAELKGTDEEVWKQMIKDADINGDGKIDFN